MPRSIVPSLTAALILGGAAAGAGQDTAVVVRPDRALAADTAAIPREVAEEAVRRFNAPTTLRMLGRSTIPAAAEVQGDIGVLGGPLVVAGTIRGSVVAINADVEFVAGSAITGDLFIVGGRALGLDAGQLGGELREYAAVLRVRRRGDEVTLEPQHARRLRDLAPRTTWHSASGDSYSSLTLAPTGTYNRVEGLPIVVGPEIGWRAGGDLRFRVSAFGIVRTAGDLTGDRSDLGYTARGEAIVGRRGPTVTLGARAFDVVSPIEAWQLSDAEVGWATFLLHRDYRDYYLAKGAAGYVRLAMGAGVSLTAEVARTRESSVAARDPWTLFRSSEPWRANPLVDDGRYTSLRLTAELDSRNDADAPTSGWLLRADWERGSSSDVTPAPLPRSLRPPPPAAGYAFHHAFLDVRRYARVSPNGLLNLRFAAGGWIGGDALPVQRRLSLGGPGPLPGYGFRSQACNAGVGDPSAPALCDRLILVQAEYRTHLGLDLWKQRAGPNGNDRGDSWLGFDGLEVVAFADAGQAWLVGDGPGRVPSKELPTLNTWVGDLGVGLDVGGLGLYLAKAFTDGEPLRLVARLRRRF